MALKPIDEAHAAQILAGTDGRLSGHRFEEKLARELTLIGAMGFVPDRREQSHLVVGTPAVELLAYIARDRHIDEIESVEAWWVGGLATTGEGDRFIGDSGAILKKSKSDVIVRLQHAGGELLTGVGIKTCNKQSPTNAQLYFTTASAFVALLRRRGLSVSEDAEVALRMFCGDPGYRPCDGRRTPSSRLADPTRWFWEELPKAGRSDWELLISDRQAEVTESLIRYAYSDDAVPPDYLLHQRTAATSESAYPLALYSIGEFVMYSCRFSGFATKPYRIRKGRFKADPATHFAPRFGFVQFQRGGQKQHPTQLQFNLQAGYFNKTPPIAERSGE